MMHIKSRTAAEMCLGIVTGRLCFLAGVCIAFLLPFSLQAQVASTGIVYEQTNPAKWDKIEANSGLPEEAPPKDENPSSDSEEEDSQQKTDFYDTDGYYPDDYPTPPVSRMDVQQNKAKNKEVKTDAIPGSKETVICSTTSYPCYWPVVVCLGVIVLCILILRYFLRQPAVSAPSKVNSMGKLLGALPLNQNTSLYYVAAGDRVLVIGVGQQSIALIASFPSAEFSALNLQNGEESCRQTTDAPDSPAISGNAIRNSESFKDTELAALRKDIQGLQRSIEELRKEHL